MKAHRPVSTYRLQLHPGFTFRDAQAALDYLDELGIRDVYVSPILQAERGSTHGYNVCDHGRLNTELGGEEGFLAFSDELRRRGLGLLVDVVPNHMGIATGENPWWNDVLENGRASLWADYFDIDWEPGKATLQGRVLYPLLGAQFGQVLENGELVLARTAGSFFIHYHEHELPVAPRSLLPVFELALEGLGEAGDALPADPDRVELLSIVTATRNLPEREESAPERRVERAREKEVIKGRLEALCARSPRTARALDEVLSRYNGRKGEPRSFDLLDALLGSQAYRLSYWRVASEEINYRRFFDINQLVALRMELPAVFEAAHRVLFGLAAQGRIDGLRLDHTDGLYDPAEYFAALRAAVAGEPFVVAEKILEHGEVLPRTWQIDGTTGYDALALLGGVWVDRRAEGAFSEIYRRTTGDTRPFAMHVTEGKRAVIRASFASEMNVLARALERIAEANRRSRDFTRASLHGAIIETLAAFPVYRTYVRADGSRGPRDDAHIEQAIEIARRRAPELDASIFEFLRDVLQLRESVASRESGRREATIAFVMRFQQLTGPIMAKGVEDTAFYRYARLVSLSEVGGDPSRFGTDPSELHEAARRRRAEWPLSMVATSTHDTKRGEDVRARLAVLTEMPARWSSCVEAWSRFAERHATTVDEVAAPDATDRYVFFQTVFGAWPFGQDEGHAELVERLVEYMRKACREAKVHTSWHRPDEPYEAATTAFVQAMLGDDEFVQGMRRLVQDTATFAATNALSQVVVKLAGPGVPDLYQGSELWNLSLVDPDSRREVDYGRRRAALRSLAAAAQDRLAFARGLLERFGDGVVKLYVTHVMLGLRRELPELFLDGSYESVEGDAHVLSFLREDAGTKLACIVPRLPWKLTAGAHRWPVAEAWGPRSLALPAARWRNVFTGERQAWPRAAPLSEVFGSFPVAVLLAE